MPVRTPSKWRSPKGQEIVVRFDAGKITRDEAIDEGYKKLGYDTRVNASRAFSQYLKYRTNPRLALAGRTRLPKPDRGHKAAEVEITPELEERVREKWLKEIADLEAMKQQKQKEVSIIEERNSLRLQVAELNAQIARTHDETINRALSVAAGNVKPE